MTDGELNFSLRLDLLRQRRADQGRTHERPDRIERRLDTMSAQMGAMAQGFASLDVEHSTLERRVARLERRLELTNGGEGWALSRS